MRTTLFTILVLCGALLLPTAPSAAQDAAALVRQKQFRGALELLRKDLGGRPSRDALNLATRACLGLELPDSAFLFAQRSLEDKETNEALLLLTMAAREAGKKELAMDAARKLVKADGKNPRAMAEAGATAAACDSLNLATRWLIAARELNPAEPAVHEYLGDVYFKQSVFELAKGEYLDALKYDSLNLSPRWKLARVMRKQNQINEALAEYRKIYQIDSTKIDAILESGNLFYTYNQFGSAAQNYLAYLAKNPSNAKARFYAGKSLFLAKNYYAQAIEVLKPLEQENPPNVEALRLMAQSFYRLGRYEEAAAMYEKVIAAAPPSATDLAELGTAYARLKKYPEAVDRLNQSLRFDSTGTETLWELGQTYYKMDDFENAIGAYRRTLLRDSTFAPAWINIGYAQFRLTRYDSAALSFGNFIRMKPDNIAGYLWLGRTWAQADSLHLEEPAYLKVVEIGETDTAKYHQERGEAFYSLAYLKAKQKEFRPATEFINKAIAIEPDNADYWVMLAQIHAQQNKVKEAEAAVRKALKLEPGNKNALKLLKILQTPQPPK